METTSQIKKLDTLLELFKEEQEAIGWHVIKEMMGGKGVEVSEYEIERYVNQLMRDNLIMQNSDSLFLIRIEGLLSESYEQKIANRAAENMRLGNLESSQRINQRWLIVLTAIAAIGTFIAAIYYLFEIDNIIHEKHLYWIWQSIPKNRN